jgi:amidase
MSRITFHFALLLSLWAAPAFAQNDQIADKGIAELSADLAAGKVSSETLVKAYLNRISMIDDAGPRLNAVLATMPDAIAVAKDRDAERKAGRLRGTLHGIPILIKDNIEAAGPVPTTAGSLALKDNVTNRDAGLVARLKAAGAIILGKTNLSEWANIRDNSSTTHADHHQAAVRQWQQDLQQEPLAQRRMAPSPARPGSMALWASNRQWGW